MFIYLWETDAEQNEKKFALIYEQYRKLMYYVAYQVLQNHHDAEDAVINALWKIAQNISMIDDPKCPKTKRLIVTVTERQAIDLYRKKKRESWISLEDWMECGVEPSTEQNMDGDVVSDAINRLPSNYRQVILLKFADGYSTREIAQLLGYSVSKVEKLISRGKKKLEQLLGEEEDP